MKISLICMKMNLLVEHIFHMSNGCTQRLILTQRQNATQKWPICADRSANLCVSIGRLGKHEGREFKTRPGKRTNFFFLFFFPSDGFFSFFVPQVANKCLQVIIFYYFARYSYCIHALLGARAHFVTRTTNTF